MPGTHRPHPCSEIDSLVELQEGLDGALRDFIAGRDPVAGSAILRHDP